jgi:cytochrome P450
VRDVQLRNEDELYYDPYRVDIAGDPYPVFRRLREEAPLYYNEEHEFYALSRWDDLRRGFGDHETFSSARGAIIEMIKANPQFPNGVFIFEDPPLHTVHRGVLKRVFTPRKMDALEPQIRDFCARCLDPLVGTDRFDLIADLGAQMPMAVIGMLLGIPEEDQRSVRDQSDANLRTEAGKPMRVAVDNMTGEGFAEYVDWRETHPSDDLMTELLNVEFEDEKGELRKLTREEILTFVQILAGAGNETTNRLIGWTGKTLADHPDQRRELAENPGLIPDAIEEVLRFEPPAPHASRYVTRDVELYGRTVPAGSAIMFLIGSANRDERQFSDGDRFDIHRKERPRHITFGYGTHACLGAALARVEGRVALEELLKRFPEWDVDTEAGKLSSTSTVRGWETLPCILR